MESEEEYMVVSDDDESSDTETGTTYNEAPHQEIDGELSAIFEAAEESQTPLMKTLERYGIAIIEIEDTPQSAIARVIASFKAAVVLATPHERKSFELYQFAVTMANQHYLNDILLIVPPCDKVWGKINTGWPVNLKIVLLADELNALAFERRVMI